MVPPFTIRTTTTSDIPVTLVTTKLDLIVDTGPTTAIPIVIAASENPHSRIFRSRMKGTEMSQAE